MSIHKHYWLYHPAQIQGRRKHESVVVRSCAECPARQMAVAKDWRPARGDYALDEHYAPEGSA